MNSKYFILLSLLVLSCKPPNSSLFKIDPEVWRENNVTLSALADDIQYISLDNFHKFSISTVSNIQKSPDQIFIFVKDTGIVSFSLNGKIVNRIGNIGRGPEEYINPVFSVDENTGEIFVLDLNNKIKVYSKTGKYLREISLNRYGNNFVRVDLFKNSLFVSEYLSGGDAKFNWIILDTLGNLIKSKKNSLQPFDNNVGVSGTTYKYDNKIYYCNFFNDTVFSISADLNFTAAYLYTPGKNRWPMHAVSPDRLYEFVYPGKLFETNLFLVSIYGYHKKNRIAFINKKTKKVLLTDRNNPDFGIQNDIDGGLMFDILHSFYYHERGNDFLMGLIDVHKLKTRLAGIEFKNNDIRYPEKRKELLKLANNLIETDNPVLMIVKMKN